MGHWGMASWEQGQGQDGKEGEPGCLGAQSQFCRSSRSWQVILPPCASVSPAVGGYSELVSRRPAPRSRSISDGF